MIEKFLDEDVNAILGLDKDYAKIRQKICEECPIFSESHNGVCNSKLWIQPGTDNINFQKTPGFVQGCGCILKFKWSDPMAKCVAGKW